MLNTVEARQNIAVHVAVFANRPRMVTGSEDNMVRLWDMDKGIVIKEMKGHPASVQAVAVSRDGKLIASGDYWGGLFTWDGDTGKSLTHIVKAHSNLTCSLDFSPDGAVLATGSSSENTMKLWNTKTWQPQGNPLDCGNQVNCVRYSPSGEHLAIATFEKVQIWDQGTRECIVNFTAHSSTSFPYGFVLNLSLAWSPDSARLLSVGSVVDPTVREWDSTTWQQVGDPWSGHTDQINAIAVNPAGTLAASASGDGHVILWQLSDRQTIAIFDHSDRVHCVTFSTDGKHVLSGGEDKKISAWAVPEYALVEDAPEENLSNNDISCENNEALLDAQKVIKLDPSSYRGYELKRAALHDAQRYDEAIEAFEMMLSKLDDAGSDPQLRKLRKKYVSLASEVEDAIGKITLIQLHNAPLRLLRTTTGLLCDRQAQISAFKTSIEYKELLSFTMEHTDVQTERIEEVVEVYFRCVMLSHRWEGAEPLLHDIQGKDVYKLKTAGGLMKLQSFCKVARDAGYHWAWVDSCCIDQNNNVELQKSLNSMFTWYRDSALTAVYLSDVPPSSKSGALAKSAWNTRGWTVPEFLAPKNILFYQNDWSLYLDDRSSNHKESITIIQELEEATGIDAQVLVSFQPGMTSARDKLQWASTRETTVQEDIAYSLFGLFGVQLPILYGENKQNALGRLLQEIVSRSGDITALDWVGKPSEFNSCLPADIFSYSAPPCAQSSLSDDDEQISLSSLRSMADVDLATKLYSMLDNLSAPRFFTCRLQLPCIAFRVIEVGRGQAQGQCFKYEVKANGLRDLEITTADKLIQFSRVRPTRQKFLLVRPWDRSLLEQSDYAEPDFANDTQSDGNWSEPGSPLHDLPDGSTGENELVDLESSTQALRLVVRLGQAFGALLLAQRGGEYKRIASDHDIIAQVKDMASIHDMMDVMTLEIL